MTATTSLQNGARMTLVSLLKDGDVTIEIPRLQRDFAQGRKGAQTIRNSFLQVLRRYLDEGEPKRDLDFIYGSMEDGKQRRRFIPLDGQQRLTTLFLLHWYLAQKDEKGDDFRRIFAVTDVDGAAGAQRSKFAYETRTSAREFCDLLVAYDLDGPVGELINISSRIVDEPWYFIRWQHDPTISGMLTMLDAIHVLFRDAEGYYHRLANKEIITFLFLELRDFGLTDDLYLKMNSRGKPLTPFENLKAKIEQFLSHGSKSDDRQYELAVGHTRRLTSAAEYFSHRIDTTWSDYFWEWRNVADSDEVYDTQMVNFIMGVLVGVFASIHETDLDMARLKQLVSGPSLPAGRQDFDTLVNWGVITVPALTELINAFDAIATFTGEKDLIKSVLQGKPSFEERILFFGLITYLVSHPTGQPLHQNDLDQWMRILRNLVNNTIINGSEELVRAAKGIRQLFPAPQGVLLAFMDSNTSIRGFFEPQIVEERIKAHLIARPNVWADQILKLDAQPYLEGQIGFVLDRVGILDYFRENDDCNWSAQEDQAFLSRFSDTSERVRAVFDLVASSGSRGFDYAWERAVLSKGDYRLDANNNRWSLLTGTGNTLKRDYSWKRLLRLSSDAGRRSENADRRQFVFDVLFDERFDPASVQTSLERIAEDIPNDWRKFLMIDGCVEIFEYMSQGFMVLDDETDVKLLGQSQRNHYHRELVSYSYFIRKLQGFDVAPFSDPWYYDVRSAYSDYPAAVLGKWFADGKEYAADIRFRNNQFEIVFFSRDGDTEILRNAAGRFAELGYQEWERDGLVGYISNWSTEKELDKAIVALRKLLKELA